MKSPPIPRRRCWSKSFLQRDGSCSAPLLVSARGFPSFCRGTDGPQARNSWDQVHLKPLDYSKQRSSFFTAFCKLETSLLHMQIRHFVTFYLILSTVCIFADQTQNFGGPWCQFPEPFGKPALDACTPRHKPQARTAELLPSPRGQWCMP